MTIPRRKARLLLPALTAVADSIEHPVNEKTLREAFDA
jgi:hypothetical protein